MSAGPAWAEEGDALVRGLAHALSNRVAALSLAADDLHDEAAEVRQDARARIATEVERLAALDRLLKLVPAERAARPQALLPSEVLADALALHAHHPELRDVPIAHESTEAAPPVRVPRSTLLRLLVLLLSSARRAADGGGVSVRLNGDDAELRVTVAPAGEPGEATALAASLGGRVEREEAGLALVLPSLAALRAREGRS